MSDALVTMTLSQVDKRGHWLRRIAIAAVVVAVLGGAIWIWLTLRAGDLAVAAVHGQRAVERNDPDALWDITIDTPEETGATRESFRAVWTQIALPVLKRLGRGRLSAGSALNEPATEGVADIEFPQVDGTTLTWAVTTWPTENGPRSTVLYESLIQAWVLDHYLEHPGAVGRVNPALAKVEGVRRDRSRLESWGIRGAVAPHGGFRTWDQLESHWLRLLEAGTKR